MTVVPGVRISDEGDTFYLVFQHQGCDITIGLDDEPAGRVAAYIAARLAKRGGGAHVRN